MERCRSNNSWNADHIKELMRMYTNTTMFCVFNAVWNTVSQNLAPVKAKRGQPTKNAKGKQAKPAKA